MTSFADLFNPSFFIILGIVMLLVALVVVYFEHKMREQNHKFASMLSLVSTLAEDMTGLKAGLSHLAMTSVNGGGQYTIPQNTPFPPENLGNTRNHQNSLHLIEVSDDESDNSETDIEEELVDESESDESESDEENSQDNEDIEGDTSSESDEEDEPIKVIKLHISDDNEEDNNNYEESNQLDFENDDDLAVLEDIDDIPVMSQEYTEEMLSLTYDEVKEEEQHLVETIISTATELKTISINLGEEQTQSSEHIEYKKLQLPKLRSIVVEKGLTSSSEAQKLKKPELLKLLGVE